MICIHAFNDRKSMITNINIIYNITGKKIKV